MLCAWCATSSALFSNRSFCLIFSFSVFLCGYILIVCVLSPFSFVHYIVCLSSIYPFGNTFLYLQFILKMAIVRFQNSVVSFIYRGNRSTRRKPVTCCMSLPNKLDHIMLYRVHFAISGILIDNFKVFIGTGCRDSYKFLKLVILY